MKSTSHPQDFNAYPNGVEPNWKLFDKLEIHAMTVDEDGNSEPTQDGEQVSCYTVFGHYAPGKGFGTESITDCSTRQLADWRVKEYQRRIDAVKEHKPLTLIERQNHLRRDGVRCPRCSSYDIEGQHPDIDAGEITQSVNCNACGLAYTDLYKLSNVALDGGPWETTPRPKPHSEIAYKRYEKGGTIAVFAYAKEVGITELAHCNPCEIDTPVFDGACLVCGTSSGE